jgi:hypothetical protein
MIPMILQEKFYNILWTLTILYKNLYGNGNHSIIGNLPHLYVNFTFLDLYRNIPVVIQCQFQQYIFFLRLPTILILSWHVIHLLLYVPISFLRLPTILILSWHVIHLPCTYLLSTPTFYYYSQLACNLTCHVSTCFLHGLTLAFDRPARHLSNL